MKKLQYKLVLIVLAVAGLMACTRQPELTLPDSPYIEFGQQHTRGLPVESGHAIHDGTSFGVYVYHKASSPASVTGGYMDNQEVVRSGNEYRYEPKKIWPVAAEDELNFFACYPYADGQAESGLSVVYGDPAEPSMTLTYEMDTDPSRHIDLMYASTGFMTRQMPVALDFRHALTRVTFAARTSGYQPGLVTITEVCIRDVVTRGELTVTEQTGVEPVAEPTWRLDPESRGDLVMDLSNGLNPAMTLGNDDFESILNPDGTGDWMVLPQYIGNLMFEIKFSVAGNEETYTQEFLLIGTENWGMGEWINYNMDFGPDGVRFSVDVQYWTGGNTNLTYETNCVFIRDINGNDINYLVWVKDDSPAHREIKRVYFSAEPQKWLKVKSYEMPTGYDDGFRASAVSDDIADIGLVPMTRGFSRDIAPQPGYVDRNYRYGTTVTFGLYESDGVTETTYNNGDRNVHVTRTLNLVSMRHFLELTTLHPAYPLGGQAGYIYFSVYGRWRVKSVTEHPVDGVSPLIDRTYGSLFDGQEKGSPLSYSSNSSLGFRTAAQNAAGGSVEVVVESLDGFQDVSFTIGIIGDLAVPAPHTGWAGSNIYWDEVNQRLTFDGVGETAHEHYQGLFFKWGSLVGISPRTTAYSPGLPLYAPEGYLMPSAEWHVIPYVTYSGSQADDVIHYDYLGRTLRPDRGVGDLCVYLSGKPGIPAGNWRMPTAAEFLAEQFTMSGTFAMYYSDNDYGQYPVQSGYTLGSGVFLPVSLSSSVTNTINAAGNYWTSSLSPGVQGTASSLRMTHEITELASTSTTIAMPVRCVRAD